MVRVFGGVSDVLTRDGYRVSIAQPPLTGLDEDVAAIQRVLDQLDGPVILVGNSYGGSIITVAGSDASVVALGGIVRIMQLRRHGFDYIRP